MTSDRAHLTAFLNSIAPGCAGNGDDQELQLESLALLQVVVYLEHNYGIRLADRDVEPEDLRSIPGILKLIERCP